MSLLVVLLANSPATQLLVTPQLAIAQAALPSAEDFTFHSGRLDLHGVVYRPQGSGPFPAIVFNHGAGREGWKRVPVPYTDLAARFVDQGYIFFAPERRGYGESPGDYLLDTTAQEENMVARSRLVAAVWEVELADVIAAVGYVKQQPAVDQNRIVLAGHSMGGGLTLFAADRGDLGLRAAVTFSAIAANWKPSPDLQQRALGAVRQTSLPIFMIDAQNDYDTTPFITLSGELQRLGKPHKAVLFPAFGETNAEGHGFCAAAATELCWPEISSFLREFVGN
jgi:carboxymethylenebutenolidase